MRGQLDVEFEFDDCEMTLGEDCQKSVLCDVHDGEDCTAHCVHVFMQTSLYDDESRRFEMTKNIGQTRGKHFIRHSHHVKDQGSNDDVSDKLVTGLLSAKDHEVKG